MKKAYSKPDIFFEDFSLSTNIAAGCEWFPDGSGGVLVGHIMYFIEPVTGCTNKVNEDGWNGICYHIPNESNTVFNS